VKKGVECGVKSGVWSSEWSVKQEWSALLMKVVPCMPPYNLIETFNILNGFKGTDPDHF